MAAVPTVRFPVFGLVRMLGLAAAAGILFWAVHYRGGMALSTDEESKLPIFNVRILRPLLIYPAFSRLRRYIECDFVSSAVGGFD
jgi:hypothetical protein